MNAFGKWPNIVCVNHFFIAKRSHADQLYGLNDIAVPVGVRNNASPLYANNGWKSRWTKLEFSFP